MILGTDGLSTLPRVDAQGRLMVYPRHQQLYDDAVAAAQAAGASLWLFPPASLAAPATYGPFVGSDGSGGNPALGSGVIGWLRDAGGGLIGPELVTNGDFSSDTWWSKDATVTISGGTANFASTPASSGIFRPGLLTVGKTYAITYTISSLSAGAVRVVAGSNAGSVRSSAGTYTDLVVCASSGQFYLQAFSGSPTTGAIDNVSVRELPGNHATQSTSGNRPVYVAAPGAAAAAAGYGAASYDGANDDLRTTGQVVDMNSDYYLICAFRQTTVDSSYRWPFAPYYNGSGNRMGIYMNPSGVPVFLIRPNSGSGSDFEPAVGPAKTAGQQHVVCVERVGGVVNAYNADGSLRQTWTPTFTSYGTGSPCRIGSGESFFSGTVSMAACGNGVLTAAQRKALLDLAVYTG